MSDGLNHPPPKPKKPLSRELPLYRTVDDDVHTVSTNPFELEEEARPIRKMPLPKRNKEGNGIFLPPKVPGGMNSNSHHSLSEPLSSDIGILRRPSLGALSIPSPRTQNKLSTNQSSRNVSRARVFQEQRNVELRKILSQRENVSIRSVKVNDIRAEKADFTDGDRNEQHGSINISGAMIKPKIATENSGRKLNTHDVKGGFRSVPNSQNEIPLMLVATTDSLPRPNGSSGTTSSLSLQKREDKLHATGLNCDDLYDLENEAYDDSSRHSHIDFDDDTIDGSCYSYYSYESEYVCRHRNAYGRDTDGGFITDSTDTSVPSSEPPSSEDEVVVELGHRAGPSTGAEEPDVAFNSDINTSLRKKRNRKKARPDKDEKEKGLVRTRHAQSQGVGPTKRKLSSREAKNKREAELSTKKKSTIKRPPKKMTG